MEVWRIKGWDIDERPENAYLKSLPDGRPSHIGLERPREMPSPAAVRVYGISLIFWQCHSA